MLHDNNEITIERAGNGFVLRQMSTRPDGPVTIHFDVMNLCSAVVAWANPRNLVGTTKPKPAAKPKTAGALSRKS